MRLARYDVDGESQLFADGGGGWVKLWVDDVRSLLAQGADGHRRLEEAARQASADSGPPAGARVLAPLIDPGKMIFVGGNYRDALEALPPEVQAKFRTDEPMVFAKLPSSIIGPGDAVELPPAEESSLDYEGELAVVIGRRGRHLTRENALDYIFGYTILNDISDRQLQHKLQQPTLGKGMDTFCPMGPVIVLQDEIPSPEGLEVSTRVNGEIRQTGNTDNLIFTIPDILFHVSKYVTLEPGDIISTGTPGGIAMLQTPPPYMHAGDTVVVEIAGIGRLENHIVATAAV